MPRKQQGWITFQSSEEERQILEQHCQQSQRSKTEVLRELVRSLDPGSLTEGESSSQQQRQEHSGHKKSIAGLKARAMKVSARNALKGTIKQVIKGAVNTEVTLEIAPGVQIVSIITTDSAVQLGLVEGKEAYAVIKSSHVMIAVD